MTEEAEWTDPPDVWTAEETEGDVVEIPDFVGREWVETFRALKDNLRGVETDAQVVAKLTATFVRYVDYRIYAEADGQRREVKLWDRR